MASPLPQWPGAVTLSQLPYHRNDPAWRELQIPHQPRYIKRLLPLAGPVSLRTLDKMIGPIQASRHSSMPAILLLFFYAARTQATYYIDDQNNSILYSGGNSCVIDSDQGSFNQTL
jgi:hypothetical protein